MRKLYTTAAFLLTFCFSIHHPVSAQVTFYEPDIIQKIEIFFSQPNWQYQLDTAKVGAGGYIKADRVIINGTSIDTVGVRYKGSSSYDPSFAKNPFKIELDHYKSQSYQGIKDIKLSNGFADPSMIREALSYYVIGHYMIAPRANYAQVYINNELKGLYTNVEHIGKSYCSKNFNISGTAFIKCNPIDNPTPMMKSNLRYISNADSSAYFNLYDLKSNYGWNELVELCDIVTNNQEEVETILDMDRVIWLLAFNSLLVNLDSYSGVFAQNYYLYKGANQRFNPIIWDLNMSFGGFPYVGNSNTSMGGLTIPQMKQLPPSIHANDPYWPLINIVMNKPEYRKKYFAHLKTIADEMFVSGEYLTKAIEFQQIIDTALQSDQNKFFTYEQFLNGMNTDYPVLNYFVPGIENLMSARLEYLNTLSEYNADAPVVTNVQPEDPNPEFNSLITIQAEVSNATSVYLHYRLSSINNFSKIEMFASKSESSIYTGSFLLNTNLAQYYITAFNDEAAVFSPARAEHEYYSINIDITAPVKGEVVINEFLAQNTSGVMNEYGEYADWIELFNTTSDTLSLFGLFMSDEYNNLTKFAFPRSVVVPPKGYLVIFADEMPSTESFIHCNFKLSSDGDAIYISNGAGEIIDNVAFGAQSSDISMGRCPNAYGDFIFLDEPSFGTANNCPPGTLDIIAKWDFNNETLIPSIGNGSAINIGDNTYTWGKGLTGDPDIGWNTLNYPAQEINSGTAGVQFDVSTEGFKNIHISYFHRNSGTSSRFVSMQYTIDGINWTEHNIYANGPPHDVFNHREFDLSSVTEISNNANFGIRILSIFSPFPFTDPQEPNVSWQADEAYRATRDNRNYSPTGTWRFDDVVFSGTLITGITEISDSPDVQISNGRNVIFIKVDTNEPVVAGIYNILGQPVFSKELRGSNHYTLPCSQHPGIYIIRITGSDFSVSKKVMFF